MQEILEREKDKPKIEVPGILDLAELFSSDKSQIYLLGVRVFNQQAYRNLLQSGGINIEEKIHPLELTTAIFPENPIISRNNGQVTIDGVFFYQVSNVFRVDASPIKGARIDLRKNGSFQYAVMGPSHISKEQSEKSIITKDFVLPQGSEEEFYSNFLPNEWYKNWWYEVKKHTNTEYESLESQIKAKMVLVDKFVSTILDLFSAEDIFAYSEIQTDPSHISLYIAPEDMHLPLFSFNAFVGRESVEEKYG